MAKLTGWRWYVGHADDVEADGVFDNDFATRDEAVAWGQAEYPGAAIALIEARHWARKDHDGSDSVPFARFKNRETVQP